MITLPPYAQMLGLSVDGKDGNVPILRMPFDISVIGRPGFLHGGALSGMLEMAAILALHTELDAENSLTQFKPVNITIDFMRGGRDKDTRAIGIVTRTGTRIANVEALAWQDDRANPIASARMHFLLSR